MTAADSHTPDERPFAAPCRRLPAGAAIGWLRQGWRDFMAAPGTSLAYGSLIVLLSAAVVVLAWWVGRYVLVLAALSGFIFVAPVLATGLYSISRQLGRGEQPSLGRSIRRMRRTLGDAMVFALVLMVISLVWVRAASMVHVFFPVQADAGWQQFIAFLAVGTAVGSIFALIIFAAAAFSLPMVADRDSDMITGCVTSINAVLRNKPAMAVWAALIVGLTAVGFLTLGLGLAVVVPWLGYATWHGYLETIDPSQWEPAEITE